MKIKVNLRLMFIHSIELEFIYSKLRFVLVVYVSASTVFGYLLLNESILLFIWHVCLFVYVLVGCYCCCYSILVSRSFLFFSQSSMFCLFISSGHFRYAIGAVIVSTQFGCVHWICCCCCCSCCFCCYRMLFCRIGTEGVGI